MEARERLTEQHNCGHWHYQGEHHSKCCVNFSHTASDCAEASCLLLGDSLKGVEDSGDRRNDGNPCKNHSPPKPLFLGVWAKFIVHRAMRMSHIPKKCKTQAAVP